jgi:hypothetical protein
VRAVEAAIDTALDPEYDNMQFRIWVSGFFSMLIAVMIIAYFTTIFRSSQENIGPLLLSDGGLQFVTIFVLIIAIILFGILSILEGRELAAILSGIAGYILGRGGQISRDKEADRGGRQDESMREARPRAVPFRGIKPPAQQVEQETLVTGGVGAGANGDGEETAESEAEG